MTVLSHRLIFSLKMSISSSRPSETLRPDRLSHAADASASPYSPFRPPSVHSVALVDRCSCRPPWSLRFARSTRGHHCALRFRGQGRAQTGADPHPHAVKSELPEPAAETLLSGLDLQSSQDFSAGALFHYWHSILHVCSSSDDLELGWPESDACRIA